MSLLNHKVHSDEGLSSKWDSYITISFDVIRLIRCFDALDQLMEWYDESRR